MKKTLALLLVFTLGLGLLTGCGKTEQKEAGEPKTEGEKIYTAAFRELAFPKDAFLQAAVLDDGVLTLALHVQTGESMGGEAAYVSRLYRVDADGALNPLGFELPGLVQTDDGRVDFSSSDHIESLFARPDGSLVAVVQRYSYWYEGTLEKAEQDEDYWQHVRSESAYRLLLIDGGGEVLDTRELQLPQDEELYLDFQRAETDSEGRIYAASDDAVFVFDESGALVAEIPTDGWTRDFARLPDGHVLARIYGSRSEELCVVEAQERCLGRRYTLEDDPYQIYTGGGDWDLLFTNGTALYGWSAEREESRQIADLLACDVMADDLVLLGAMPDGTLRGLCREQGREERCELVTLTTAQRESAAQPEVLTLGTLDPDAFSRAIQSFNRSQQDVRIELRDYSDLLYGTEDPEKALTKLSTEIMSGKMPDLLALEGLPYRQLAAKGLLEDLYPYLDADPELSRDSFFASALKSMEVGGGLYQVAPRFTVISLMGAASVVGDTPGWTYDELNAALETMPEGCTVLGPYTGRDEILQMCLFLEMDHLVDWETGECRFESGDFVKLLDFVNRFPQEIDYEAGDASENPRTRIASGKQLLIEADVSDPDELGINEQVFGGEATYIGFPTSEGVGNILYVDGGVAMSSSCHDKAAAWRFLRQIMSAEETNGYSGGLPMNRAAFDRLITEAMEGEYEKDENGEYKLDPETGERIPLPKGGGGMSEGGGAVMEYTIWPMTERQRDKLLDLIECSTRSVDMNMQIYGIVRDEAQAFFAGQKSAEEVARLIQSKVSLYVNEQR